MSARPRLPRGEGEKLREEILAAVEDLLTRTSDPRAVSIRAVADAVGVTAPSIYRHFADKRALLFAVCEGHFDALQARIEKMVEAEADPVDALRTMAHAYVDWGVEHPEEYRMMFMTRPERVDGQDAYDDTIGRDTAFGLLERTIEACMREGRMRQGDVFEIATALFAIVHGVTAQAISNDARFFPETDPHRTMDIIFEAVVAGLR